MYLQELYNSLGFINLNKPLEVDNLKGMSLLAKAEDLYQTITKNFFSNNNKTKFINNFIDFLAKKSSSQ